MTAILRNAAEAIIAFAALRKGGIEVAKSPVIGSIPASPTGWKASLDLSVHAILGPGFSLPESAAGSRPGWNAIKMNNIHM